MSLTAPTPDDLFPAPARRAAPYLVLALAVFAVYGNVYDNVFLFDDALLIQLNSFLRGWGHIGDLVTGSTTGGVHIVGGFYRPVQMLLYLLAFNLGGGTPFLFHFLNVALHAANSCLVYRLGIKLNFKPVGVFLAALLWGIHPLHTEAVTYMSATADPLFALFCLWGILTLLPDFTTRQMVKAFPLFLLGLLSKETTVMFPLLVMVCLFYTQPDRLNWRIYLRTWPFWLISLSYVVWRMEAQGFDGPQTYKHLYQMQEYSVLRMYADHPLDRVYTFLATLPSYLQLLAWPTGLHMERSFPIYTEALKAPVIVGFGMLLFAMAHIGRSCRKPYPGLVMGWGLLWCGAAHAPDTGLLIPMNSLFLEHWMYLPSVGLFLAIAETLQRLVQNRPKFLGYGLAAIALVFTAILAIKTYDQNKIWRQPDSFYNNIFAYGETSARARNNLALYYSSQGDYPRAIEQFQEAIKTSDVYAETRYNLALTYLALPDRMNHIDDALKNINRSLEIDPHFFRSYQMLGDIYGNLLGDPEKAKAYYAQAVAQFKQQP